ncbi:hypothetical protein Dthio_PD1365 [Desulfonatronospira thiodismutans ASO3-1]|uniref:ParB/Sulfiredoxin domain-containing protein n=1 Tax=Desulfonatronospira thiodismutans ASO3-1 TaxID=555779 RepID=D6STL0_9BACT|nr:hypothetical protein [Desulfonatronospira thiodismutans]EFI34026.1 hypothetical protein Dthio_PD1365 [Desulfonatronospira thiodismutans ASO3-1]
MQLFYRQKMRRHDKLCSDILSSLNMRVNPRDIRYFAKYRPWQRKLRFLEKIGLKSIYHFIRNDKKIIITGGLKPRLFSEHFKYIFLKELWDNNLDYTCTKRFKLFKDRIDAGKEIVMPVKGYRLKNLEDLESYFQDYVRLLESMSAEGFLAQKSNDELLVIIGEKGELIKTSRGRHRLAAAQITGIESIPVRVRHIHQSWVEMQKAGRAGKEGLAEDIALSMQKVREMYSS